MQSFSVFQHAFHTACCLSACIPYSMPSFGMHSVQYASATRSRSRNSISSWKHSQYYYSYARKLPAINFRFLPSLNLGPVKCLSSVLTRQERKEGSTTVRFLLDKVLFTNLNKFEVKAKWPAYTKDRFISNLTQKIETNSIRYYFGEQ